MATLVLQAAGAAVGGLFGPVGAFVGRTVGGVAGALVDASLFGTNAGKSVVGPRLTVLHGISATEGAPIPRHYGRVRTGGQMIWATRFQENATVTRQGSQGGKSFGSAPTSTTYTYAANFAIGLCEGPIGGIRRIWADGREIDQTAVTLRVYTGTETQEPDPLMIAKEGAENVCAYRGLAYVVFEGFPIGDYGNRIPQLSFEVLAPVDGLAKMIRAIDIIPGASEYAYSPVALTRSLGPGASVSENRHVLTSACDWQASLDALQALCPNLVHVALVVSWFGDDLRADRCTIAPRVEIQNKTVLNADWAVAGLNRYTARLVSTVEGLPAYGGTPSDGVVAAAVQDLQRRGLRVVFYPFVMMDVPAGNGLPDPWTGAASQPAYPWRGRITCTPAVGQSQSPDGTDAARQQIQAFFGTQQPGDGEWSYRRFVLHYARLCADIGGLDGFLIGSELVGLTRVCAASGVYPAPQALAQLAQDVKTSLGQGTKVLYSADWTEYGADVRHNGADVRFPLDVVWSSPAINAIGIDAYWPLSDWRDSTNHLDAEISDSIYDRTYLASRLRAGEGFDWYYASDTDRDAQLRTPITDGAYNKPWIFRCKDVAGWWSNRHIERVNGKEVAGPTAWIPQSKPIWLMELGCPAVDRGANGPNAFPDTKSSENSLPPYSRGYRDDLMQARVLESVLGAFDPAKPLFSSTTNPVSSVYNGPMVDPARMYIWAWDARPFPAFPNQSQVWADGANWEKGHWLNGRLDGLSLDQLVQTVVRDLSDQTMDLPAIDGFLDGYTIDQTMSVRGALEPLAGLFGFDARVQAGSIACFGRQGPSRMVLGDDDLLPDKSGRSITLSRAHDSDLPKALALNYVDGDQDYRPATVQSRQLTVGSKREVHTDTTAVLSRAEAQRLCDIWLQDLWVARERADFTLRPGLVALDPGDAVTLTINGSPCLFRIEKLTDGSARVVSARAVDPAVYDYAPSSTPRVATPAPAIAGPAHVVIVDLAYADGNPTTLQYAAVYADPWTGPLALWRANGAASYDYVTQVSSPCRLGTTQSDLAPGPLSRFDVTNTLVVQIDGGALSSVSDEQMLGGTNRMALCDTNGDWEIIGYCNAELIASNTYKLSRLLRGLGGQDYLAQRTLPAGAAAVVLDDNLIPLSTSAMGFGATTTWRVGPANRDYADPSYISLTTTSTNKALRPLAPVHVRASRSEMGVTIAFKRRGRLSADAWEPVEIPLGEEAESYQVDIFKNGAVVRTLMASQASLVYAAADEITDFQSPQTSLSVRICQLSTVAGFGYPMSCTLCVH